MGLKLTFLGAVGTVTGSKYLIEAEGKRFFVDCGLFQGFKQLRLRNWAHLPVDPKTIDAVVLTHAHLDHSGYLPLLVKHGFRGPIYCTPGTADLCAILLPDSGHLQEKDAEFANRHGFSKHHPALPLYTLRDAEASLKLFSSIEFNEDKKLTPRLNFRLVPAGHILGAAMIELTCGDTKVVFSGDLGRPNSPTVVDPTPIAQTDYLLVESTYGNRKHEARDAEDVLEEIINRTAGRGGTVVIPSFAVGRSQLLMYYLHQLKQAKRIPEIPIFLDSPMAIEASELFVKHADEEKLSVSEARAVCAVARFVTSVEESKALDADRTPKVIISASGMATGGRVLHHLKVFAPDPRNAILFAGFQAGGTRGYAMTKGARNVKIHGAYVPIRAEVHNLHMLSAHADADEIMGWLRNFRTPPKKTFVTHGEPDAADALRHRIEEEFGWTCMVPEYRDTVELT